MLVGALRAANSRFSQFCAPSIFFAPLFPPSESEPPFHGTKTGFPTELPRQVSCKPEQHSILLPFCLPAVQKSLSLLSIINFYPHASCLRLSHPFFRNPAQIVGMPLFRNPVRTKFPAGRSSSLFYIVLFRIYLSAVAAPIFGILFGSSVLSAFSEIPFGQSFPLRRFTHCGTADRRATNVPRRILQTMFRSVTIFMRSTVSGNSLLPNRFSDRAHYFSNAHRERITAAASFFSSEKVRKTDGTAAARSQLLRSDTSLQGITPSEQNHARKALSEKLLS